MQSVYSNPSIYSERIKFYRKKYLIWWNLKAKQNIAYTVLIEISNIYLNYPRIVQNTHTHISFQVIHTYINKMLNQK